MIRACLVLLLPLAVSSAICLADDAAGAHPMDFDLGVWKTLTRVSV
jgi:hypothetical protein